jgi:hypothetical protein
MDGWVMEGGGRGLRMDGWVVVVVVVVYEVGKGELGDGTRCILWCVDRPQYTRAHIRTHPFVRLHAKHSSRVICNMTHFKQRLTKTDIDTLSAPTPLSPVKYMQERGERCLDNLMERTRVNESESRDLYPGGTDAGGGGGMVFQNTPMSLTNNGSVDVSAILADGGLSTGQRTVRRGAGGAGEQFVGAGGVTPAGPTVNPQKKLTLSDLQGAQTPAVGGDSGGGDGEGDGDGSGSGDDAGVDREDGSASVSGGGGGDGDDGSDDGGGKGSRSGDSGDSGGGSEHSDAGSNNGMALPSSVVPTDTMPSAGSGDDDGGSGKDNDGSAGSVSNGRSGGEGGERSGSGGEGGLNNGSKGGGGGGGGKGFGSTLTGGGEGSGGEESGGESGDGRSGSGSGSGSGDDAAGGGATSATDGGAASATSGAGSAKGSRSGSGSEDDEVRGAVVV